MPVKVRLPQPLREHAGGADELSVEAATVLDALQAIGTHHPKLRPHIMDREGRPRSNVAVYVNDVDINDASGVKTKLTRGDVLRILPVVKGESLPVLQARPLTADEQARYARHIALKEIGLEGQLRLKNRSVAVIGLGGLGSPVAQYLVAAGVGRVGLVEPDVVDASNLQRQVLYTSDDVGGRKVEAAAARLRALNPLVHVETHPVKIDRTNARAILQGYDIVVDGSDNFATRYLVNDVCVFLRKPLVYGSVHRFEGQVSVFDSRTGPCYRCLYPTPPPPHLVPNCAEAGVLGALTGIVGSLQANEALKLALGIGEPLRGRLLLVDALDMAFATVNLKKSPACPVCGPRPTITEPIDYDQFCGVPTMNQAEEKAIRVQDLKARMDQKKDFVLLDVRETDEHAYAAIPGDVLIPGSELGARIGELDALRGKEIIVYCHHGSRSNVVANFLRSKGYRAKNLLGGINAWSEEIDPNVPQY